MRCLLCISVTYLLGLDEQVSYLGPVEKSKLPILHRMPVWTKNHGWALVNSIEKTLVFTDKSDISFEAVQEPLYMAHTVICSATQVKDSHSLAPGHNSNYGQGKQANFVYFSATMDAAVWGAELAQGNGKPSKSEYSRIRAVTAALQMSFRGVISATNSRV